MDDQGRIDPLTQAALAAPPAPEPAAPPPAPQPMYAAVAPAPVSSPRRSSTGWKWFVGVMLVLILATLACCGVSFAAIGVSSGMGGSVATGDSIAVIHIDGVIAGTGSALDGVITPENILSQLDQALADDGVKAILLRIDSPGGTVAASQEIAMEVAAAAEEKPVIASVGDVGASGAYMVASQCDEIVALPTSAIGSIGVIIEIPNVAGLLDKLGVEFTVLTAGEYKDAGSPFRSMTPTETALVQKGVDSAYDEFINIVAEGRGLSKDKVRTMATGWAWSAREAEKMGLVDTLGTYNDAVDSAAKAGGIDGEPGIVSYEGSGYGDLLYSLLGIRDSLDRLGALAPDLGSSGSVALPR
ncbi:MAG: signal peptide peptidase SppA [Coriobacteriia bacterium]|nr:signal peptide peptidase SppA [Coriobacteriia bacterium]